MNVLDLNPALQNKEHEINRTTLSSKSCQTLGPLCLWRGVKRHFRQILIFSPDRAHKSEAV